MSYVDKWIDNWLRYVDPGYSAEELEELRLKARTELKEIPEDKFSFYYHFGPILVKFRKGKSDDR